MGRMPGGSACVVESGGIPVESNLGHAFVFPHPAVLEKLTHAHSEHTAVHVPVIEGSSFGDARCQPIEFMLLHRISLRKRLRVC